MRPSARCRCRILRTRGNQMNSAKIIAKSVQLETNFLDKKQCNATKESHDFKEAPQDTSGTALFGSPFLIISLACIIETLYFIFAHPGDNPLLYLIFQQGHIFLYGIGVAFVIKIFRLERFSVIRRIYSLAGYFLVSLCITTLVLLFY